MLPLREAFCFQAVGEVCVRVCVLSSVIIYCARYLINRSWKFHQIYTSVQLDTKMTWLDFEIRRSKVKGQGQSETLCTFPAEAIPSSNTV